MSAIILSNTGNGIPIQQTAEIKQGVSVDNSTVQAAAAVSSSQAVVQTNSSSGLKRIEQTQEQVIMELQKAIDAIQGPKKSFEISVHKKTNAIMIKVLNKETGDLIREVPPEKILDLAARMMEITGIIIDKKI